ncbi:MAG: cobalamin adenosyltransferase [delta proteobacterium ML8_F1]|nr:MAG: cobalamin adenosyltransferase [delta proteobacterium ML8_F1]
MKIYTKTGDTGQTSLYSEQRVDKDSARVEAYGTVDELGAALGLAKNFSEESVIKSEITAIQKKLFHVAGDLATVGTPFPYKIQPRDVEALESKMDIYLEIMNKEQKNKFILPGSNAFSASLHVARTVCRRAERRILALSRKEEVDPVLIKYVNRLSDFIYALARINETDLEYMEFTSDSDN